MVVRGCLFALAAVSRIAVGAASAALQPAEPTSAITADSSAIRKVITLIEEMRDQVDKDAKADETAYEKYMCWCKTNEEAKTKAISDAEARVERLSALIEELAAKESRLKTEIEGLAQDIAEDKDALATAQATREKEFAAFQGEEADLKETRGLLIEAVKVLSKVQLAQTSGADLSHARTALLQLQDKVSKRRPDYKSMMKRDLFEVLGSFADSIPQNAFLPRKSAALVENKLLPWEKTEEQVGAEAKANDLEGAAAGAKSYNSRSGRIVGLLSEMSDETARDLGEAQKQDFQAEVAYQNLRAAKLDEIAIASKQKKRKERELADALSQAAEAKEDREATEEALSADEKFLAQMLKDCASEDEEYQKRKNIRAEEAVAISETLKILTADDARGLYAKTVSFVQLSSSEQAGLQNRRAERAMQRIAAVARKHKNWALVSLAVRVRLDAFTKVKEAMDKMLAELQKQQKEEYEKWEACKTDIDKSEDDIKVGLNTKEDLDDKHKQLSNTIKSLEAAIKALLNEEDDMEVALKSAGEQRKDQNQIFQTSVMDQRATTNILNKALARLKQFYQTKGGALLQESQPENQPGRAVAPPPPKGKDYSKSGGAGGVVQLLMKVIEESEVASQQLEMDEQQSQKLYSEFVAATTAAIEANRADNEEKTARLAETNAAKSDTEEQQLANDAQLAKLQELLQAQHAECDYVVKYFDIRQQARAEEMDSITDAKAVLSGADFGK